MKLQQEILKILAAVIKRLVADIAEIIRKRNKATAQVLLKKLNKEIDENHERVVLYVEVMSDIALKNRFTF
ncbi:MAG: hypothetical protein R6U91_01350 [Bacillota bacterium]